MKDEQEAKKDDPKDPHNLLKECFTLFGGDYYDSFMPGITDLIKLSREKQYRANSIKHFGLQSALLERITEMDKTTTDGKQVARDNDNSQDIRTQRKRNKTLSFAYRQIADGIAWRSVGFSRFTMRVLSQSHSPGSAYGKEVGRKKEMEYATRVVGRGGFVLLHDATNYLRVGDLSVLKKIPDTPYLGEVKNKKGIATPKDIDERLAGGAPITKQEDRLWQAQIMLSSRRWLVEGSTIPITELRPINKDFVVSVGAVLKQAMKKGVYGKMLSSYMYIEAFDVHKIMSDFEDPELFKTLLDSLPTPKSELIGMHSNYDTIAALLNGEVLRAVPPYSVFPFSAEIAAKTITGQLVFRVMILRPELEREFLKHGYIFSLDEKALDKATKEDLSTELSGRVLFPARDPEGYMFIKHMETGFIFPIHMLFASMMHEFLSVEYIISVAETVRRTATPGEEKLFYPEIIDGYRWL
jgi:hypothetical protein